MEELKDMRNFLKNLKNLKSLMQIFKELMGCRLSVAGASRTAEVATSHRILSGIDLFRTRFALVALLMVMGGFSTRAWGISKTKLTVTASGNGKIAITKNSTPPESYKSYDEASTEHGGVALWKKDTYYVWVQPSTGYKCDGVSNCSWNASGYYTITITGNTGGVTNNETATFVGVDYSVIFNAEESTGGTMSYQEFVYGTAQNLTGNGYEREYTVTYDKNGGSCDETSAVATYTFAGWATDPSGDVVYLDEAEVNNLASTDGAEVNLYAKWTRAAVTLPSASKDDYLFDGWYDETDKIVGTAGTLYYPTADVTLSAHWTNRYVPTMEGSDQDMLVGQEQEEAFTLLNTDNPTCHINVLSIDSINDGSGLVIQYDAVNNKIIARNAGKAEIYFTQAETETIQKDTSEVYTYTITKRDPEFTWAGNSIYHNSTIANFFTTSNTDFGFDVESTDGEVAELVGRTLKAYNKPSASPITITVSQEENYKWKPKSESKLITVSSKANHVQFTYTRAMYLNEDITVNLVSELGTSWDNDKNSICLGNGSADVFNPASSETKDKYVDIKFEGIPETLSFNYATNQNAATDEDWYVKESINGTDWSAKIWNKDKDGDSFDDSTRIKLQPTTRYVRLCYSGNFSGYYRYVTISELQYFRKDATSFEYATNLLDHVPDVQSFVVEHANIGYQTTITAPSHYQVSVDGETYSSSINYSTNATARTGGDIMDEFTVYVKYLADEEGTHEGNVVVSNNLSGNLNVGVSGRTVKKFTPVITWTGEETTFEVGETITNGFTVENENGDLITGDLEWTFESDDTDVVELLSSNTAMRAHTLDEDIKTTTIRGVLAEGGTYFEGTSGDVTITVKRKDNTITITGVSASMLTDETMTGISVTSTNSSGPAFEITEAPRATEAVIDISDLSAVTIESQHSIGTFYWTIHQDADGTYKAADKEFSVEVALGEEDLTAKIYMYESGSNEGAGWNLNDFGEVPLVPVGVATTVWYEAKQDNSGKKYIHLKEYYNGAWSQFGDMKTSLKDSYASTGAQSKDFAHGDASTSFKFTAGGSKDSENADDFAKVYVRNVKIECSGHILTNVAGDALAITKQEDGESLIYLDAEGYETFTVYYGLAKNSGDVKLTCDNDHFTFGVDDEKEEGLTLVANDEDDTQCGNKVIKVYYNPTEVGTESATVTISNKVYNKTITITGTCKYPQTISWNIGDRLKKDTENKISNAANVTLGTAITYRSSNSDVVEVTDEGTKLLAKATGSARIYASASGNSIYYDALDSIDVTVVESVTEDAVNVSKNADWTGDIGIWTPVVIKLGADITISGEVEAYSLEIETGAKVTIAPTGGLTIGEGGISGATTENLILAADANVEGESETLGQTGYLRISPRYTGDMPSATVELFSIAYSDEKKDTWQYAGIPFTADYIDGATFCEYGKQFVYGWSETEGDWFNAYAEEIDLFRGYCLTQNKNSKGDTFKFKGTLVAPDDANATISLSYTEESAEKGYHILANSFTAPIDITQMGASDFVNATATIYLFNTGAYSKSGYTIVDDDNSTESGDYIAVSPGTAAYIQNKISSFPVVIPAMQGFCVQAIDNEASLTLDYGKIVWGANYGAHPNKPMRVKADDNSAQEETTTGTTGFLKVTLSDGESADNLYILSSKDAGYTKKYTNGYDAPKKMSDDPALPNIFAEEDGYQLAIDATLDLLGTSIGVRRGKASNYTMYFTHVTTEQDLLLLDVEENEVTLIEEGASYQFAINAEQGTVISGRFLIIEAQNGGNQGTATGTEETTVEHTMQKFIYNGRLYILKDGVLYDARGMMIKR